MADLEPVEKVLTTSMLEAGELQLSEAEAGRIGLPRFHAPVELRFGGEKLATEWHPRDKRLRGEQLLETLQLFGTAGGLARLHPSEGVIELELVERGRSSFTAARRRPSPSDDIFERRRARPEAPSQSQKPQPSRRRRPPGESRFRRRTEAEYKWPAGLRVGFLKESLTAMADAMTSGGWDEADLFELRLHGEELAAVSDFGELIALGLAKVDHMPHQEATAIKVLSNMQGRAILADEVGLGKTIEAGLILKELIIRGLARRVLILCPASLRQQWADELKEKFDEDFTIVWRGSDDADADRLISSLNLAVRNADRYTQDAWDLVIVDEAHKLAGNATKGQQLIRDLDTRYLLFLSATPVQNDLLELYRLVSLLRPGTFRSQREFKNRFVDRNDKRKPQDEKELRELVSDVMVRTTREQAGVDNVTRRVIDLPVQLSDYERELYHTITNVLRLHMTERNDHLRQRQLAHRLTTSPRGLSLTAMRVAAKHPNPIVAELLQPFADLCTDTRLTNRQKTLLQLSSDWIADKGDDAKSRKGKVLVFTQHAETLDDLLRVYANAGIDAVAYHGSMNPTARKAAIDRFRKSAEVMVSTESGAEGLNLQFCNCVINYDLPWNPMRIEQRIGRVHRLTQERDVFVANLFAVDTIDEHVHRILHDKLRMFELLFGQVTTILGELDDRDEGTFEQRILNALLSRSDTEMKKKLHTLGDEADRARREGDKLIRIGTHLDWTADRTHRKGLTTRGASELQPHVEIGRRQRQDDVERFTRELLLRLGATIEFETDDDPTGAEGKHPFWSVALPDDLAEEFGRPMLHLAFTAGALANHADAELCTVGSEFFDDLLLVLRERGDLHARMPHVPETTPGNTTPHHGDTRLIERSVAGPATWAAQATWRVSFEGTGSGDQIITTFVGEQKLFDRKSLKALNDGDLMPVTLSATGDLIDRVMRDSISPLTEMAQHKEVELNASTSTEIGRMADYFGAQITDREHSLETAPPRKQAELRTEIKQLQSAAEAYQRARRPEVELRAELIAVNLRGSLELLATETWANRVGKQAQIPVVWNPNLGPPKHVDSAGVHIQTLALCDNLHPAEANEVVTCHGCDRDLCDQCGPVASFIACAACGQTRCRACVPGQSSICPDCLVPERDSSLDRDGLIGWNLASGVKLLVGTRMALVTRSAGAAPELLVPEPDERNPERRILRAYASSVGFRQDVGLRVLDFQPAAAPPSGALAPAVVRVMEWSCDPLGGSSLTGSTDVVSDLRVEDMDTPAETEASAGLADLIKDLREQVPPAAAPCLVVTPVVTTQWSRLTEDGLLQETVRETPADTIEIIRVLAFEAAASPSEAVASIETENISVELLPLHRSYEAVVRTQDSSHVVFLPADPAATPTTEHASERLIESLRLPVRSQLGIGRVADPPTEFASPEAVELISREVHPEWFVDEAVNLDRYPSARDEGILPLAPRLPDYGSFTDSLRTALYAIARNLDPEKTQPVIASRGTRVTEVWRGHQTRSLSYLVKPGDPAWPVLDDTGKPSADFDVDSSGHLHAPQTGWICLACGRFGCVACGDQEAPAPCLTCKQPACGLCRRGNNKSTARGTISCERCSARSCADCGRNLHALQCALCDRTVCSSCQAGSTCLTCSSWRPILREAIDSLPPDLHAAGLSVVGAQDDDAFIVGLAGHARREIAVVRNGQIDSWWTATEPGSRIAAGHLGIVWNELGRGDVPTRLEPVDGDIPADWSDKLLMDELVRSTITWVLTDEAGQIVARSSKPVDVPNLEDQCALLQAINESSDEPAQTPKQMSDDRRVAVLLALGPPRPPTSASLIIHRHAIYSSVALSGFGLHHYGLSLGAARITDRGWSTPITRQGVPNWKPQPQLMAECELAGNAVALLAIPPMVVLRARRTGGVNRHIVIRDMPLMHEALGLGLSLAGVDGPTYASTTLEPTHVHPVLVVNGTLLATQRNPRLLPSSAKPDPDATRQAADLWVAPGTVEMPGLENMDLNPSTRAQLIAVALGTDPDPEPTVFDIGLDVHDRWSTPYGEISLAYSASAANPQGHVQANDGSSAPHVWIDRSMHIVTKVLECQYCQTLTCSACDDATRDCDVCGIRICGRCTAASEGEFLRCPACQSLRKLGWSERRSHPVLKLRGKKVVAGRDQKHHVFLSAEEGHLIRVILDEGGQPTAQPQALMPSRSQARVFNGALGRQVFVEPGSTAD